MKTGRRFLAGDGICRDSLMSFDMYLYGTFSAEQLEGSCTGSGCYYWMEWETNHRRRSRSRQA